MRFLDPSAGSYFVNDVDATTLDPISCVLWSAWSMTIRTCSPQRRPGRRAAAVRPAGRASADQRVIDPDPGCGEDGECRVM